MQPYTVKSYAEQMDGIVGSIEEMGALVCDAIAIAGRAAVQRDTTLRTQAKANDKDINALQEKIDQQIAEMLAQQSPMASELRFILSALKIANTLERTGDLAKNTTKRLVRCEVPFSDAIEAQIGELVKVDTAMLRAALVAFRDQDDDGALAVWKRDDEADALCRDVFSSLLDQMGDTPGQESGMVDALFAVKQFERIADYATSIAKTVHYITTGEKPRKSILEDL